MYLSARSSLNSRYEGLTTKVTGNEISEKMTDENGSSLRITFDQNVVLHISQHNSVKWTIYLADIGGAIGLWLGVGIVQLTKM